MKKFNVAVIGSGGREHAICAAIKRSEQLDRLYCIPGNVGIAEIAKCIPIAVMDFPQILQAVKENSIDIVFVAPDDPLAEGLVDYLNENNIMAFGPEKKAAVIEASKAFSKDFMQRNHIPTAEYKVFDDYEQAKSYIRSASYPLVIKADGLALGKGVIICSSLNEAEKAIEEMMLLKVFKNAGSRIIIEEFLTGNEMSVFVFTDGIHYSLMPSSQDYKKAFDDDLGPNTGGMGAITPSPYFTELLKNNIIRDIIEPTIAAMRNEGRTFKGVLYFGLMTNGENARVLEYNARFGDPETQVILPLLKTDIIDIILAIINGELDKIDIEWEDSANVGVVVASGGYPTNVIKGYPITIEPIDGCVLFHSGTIRKDEQLLTNGGRVFCLTAKGKSLSEARERVYSQIDKISFKDMRYRKDIALCK